MDDERHSILYALYCTADVSNSTLTTLQAR